MAGPMTLDQALWYLGMAHIRYPYDPNPDAFMVEMMARIDSFAPVSQYHYIEAWKVLREHVWGRKHGD